MGVRGCGITVRIIPAYAGSTDFRRAGSRLWPDHPRIRGEHALPPLRPASARGSSPHTRGARMETRRGQSQRRIIPAYAGSTWPRSKERAPWWDHPRIRGEHTASTAAELSAEGSSPHTRGAPPLAGLLPPKPGIIPAYAGSTRISVCPFDVLPDHPRIRGEHIMREWYKQHPGGSSPHTRGAPGLSVGRRGEAGIIPAYAGSTNSSRNSASPPPDHPRIRGEHQADRRGGAL